jgi:hypothetical protein
MATLSELRTLITDKLADGNLVDPTSAQIDAQINSTIEYYETDAFWFSEDIAALSTTAGNPVLDISSVTDFKQEILPNGLTIVEGQVHYPLRKLTPLQYESIFIDNAQGLPRSYVYRDSQFELWYTPDRVYTVNLFYRKTYADLASDGDSNDFTNNAARLIEYKTLADLLRDYRSDEERALQYDRRVQIEYNKIKKQTNNRTVTGYLTTENIVDRHNGYYSNYY